MNDVAAEAGMSPGNLYRYFPSKHAIVAGLVECDRAEMRDDFAALAASSDFLGALAALGQKHFKELPRERAALCLEIWAEATRDDAIARINAEIDGEVEASMIELFERARSEGTIDAKVDPRAFATIMSLLANGLFVRRAVARNHDPDREIAFVFAIVRALFSGQIPLAPMADPETAS